jgi:hypothetical protein
MGESDGMVWAIQTSPGRIALILNSLPKQGREGEFPRFTELDPPLGELLGRAGTICDLLGPLPRIGFITTFVRTQKNVTEANSSVRDELGINLDFGDFSDLAFQLNRPKLLNSVPGQFYNRLLRWSAETYQYFIAIPGREIATSPAPIAISTLNVDLNTVQTQAIFNPADQVSIFKEWHQELIRLSAGTGPEMLRD